MWVQILPLVPKCVCEVISNLEGFQLSHPCASRGNRTKNAFEAQLVKRSPCKGMSASSNLVKGFTKMSDKKKDRRVLRHVNMGAVFLAHQQSGLSEEQHRAINKPMNQGIRRNGRKA